MRSSRDAQVVEELGVALDEVVGRRPVAFDQRVADEHRPRLSGIDAVVADGAVGNDRQAVERHPLADHGATAASVPTWLAIAVLGQMLGDGLGPLGLNAGNGAGPQPVGLDQFGGDDPLRLLARQHRAAADRELRAVRPVVLGALLVGGAVTHPEVAEQTCEQRLVNAVGMARLAAGTDTQLTGDLAELAEHVVPLAHPKVVEVLATTQPPELIAAQFVLARPQVIPQLDERDEVAACRLVDGESTVHLVGSLAVFGRALARILDAQGGRDRP